MKHPPDTSWRFALMLMATLPAAIVVMAVVTLLTQARLEDSRRDFDSHSRNVLHQLAAQLDYPLISGQPALAISAIENVLSQPGLHAVRIHDASGELWLFRQQAEAYDTSATHEISAPVQLVTTSAATDDWLAQPATTPTRIVGRVVLITSTTHLLSREWALLSQGLVVAAALLLLCLVMSWLMADRLMRWQQLHARKTLQARWSHDLRTPLSGISGMLELLNTTSLDEEQRHYLRSAMAASRDLGQQLSVTPSLPVDAVEVMPMAADWQGRQVLLVEDDPVSARYAEIQLNTLGVVTTVVGTGAQALARAGEPWHLVLVDGELPDMMADELRRAWPAHVDTMPLFVALTAHDDPALLRRFRAAGLQVTLSKPLRLAELMAVAAC